VQEVMHARQSFIIFGKRSMRFLRFALLVERFPEGWDKARASPQFLGALEHFYHLTTTMKNTEHGKPVKSLHSLATTSL
jgi:hypothetical protein